MKIEVKMKDSGVGISSEIIRNNQALADAFRPYLWHMQIRATGCVLIPVRFVHPAIEDDGSLSLYYDRDGDHIPLRSLEQLDPEGLIENGSYRYYFTTFEKAIEAAKSADGFDGFDMNAIKQYVRDFLSFMPVKPEKELPSQTAAEYIPTDGFRMKKEAEEVLRMLEKI